MNSMPDSGLLVSTVIATINRSTLTRSVESVLDQGDLPMDYEVIVVNDSGCPLFQASWQYSERVTILQTNRRERCVARNTGAAVARGMYLHFLDDDDWMLPGGFKALWEVANICNASWIYGASQLVDRHGNLLTQHHVQIHGNAFVQVMAGEWIPIQASWIRSDCFHAVGGFDYRLTVCQDKDICRRVVLHGELAISPAPVVCIVRDRENSMTAYDKATAYSVWSRDNVLGERGSFLRMLKSSKTAYWRGRLIRAYLTCVVWNLRRGKILNALSRCGGAGLCAILSFNYGISPDFWRALVRSHTRENVS